MDLQIGLFYLSRSIAFGSIERGVLSLNKMEYRLFRFRLKRKNRMFYSKAGMAKPLRNLVE